MYKYSYVKRHTVIVKNIMIFINFIINESYLLV
jgi:hypothetical protein